MKLLDRNDTEHKIQKARLEEEYVSPNDELADSDSIFNGGVVNDERDKRRDKPDNKDLITWMRCQMLAKRVMMKMQV